MLACSITIINHPNTNIWPVLVEADQIWPLKGARRGLWIVRWDFTGYYCWFQVEEPDMFPYLGRYELTALRWYLDTATRPYQQHCYKALQVIICANSHAIYTRPHCGGCRCLLGIDVYQQMFLWGFMDGWGGFLISSLIIRGISPRLLSSSESFY